MKKLSLWDLSHSVVTKSEWKGYWWSTCITEEESVLYVLWQSHILLRKWLSQWMWSAQGRSLEVQDQGVSMVAFGWGPSSWFIAAAFLLGPHRTDLKLIFSSSFSHWTPWRNPWVVFLVAAHTLFSDLVVCSWRDRRLDSGNRSGEEESLKKR